MEGLGPGRGCFGGSPGTRLSSPVSDPGVPEALSARSYWEVLSPPLSWPLSQGQGSWSSPGRVGSNSPHYWGRSSPGVGGDTHTDTDTHTQTHTHTHTHAHTHTHTPLSLSLPSVSNLLLSPSSRVRSAWKLNFGCRICESGCGAVPRWE